MIEIIRICKGPLLRMTTNIWLLTEEMRRDTSHMVTSSEIQIKAKLVRDKFKHGKSS